GVTGARRRPPRRAGARPWGGTGSRARRRLLARRPLAELPREVPRGEPHAQENAGAVGAVPRAWGPVGGAARHRSRPVQRRLLARCVRGTVPAAPASRHLAQSGARRGRAASRRGAGCRDRKSTRLNSSHGSISYAVFCLKKTTKGKEPTRLMLNDTATALA